MTNVSVAQARARLSEIVNDVAYRDDRVVVQRRGKNFAVLLSFHDYEKLSQLEDQAESHMLEESIRHGKFISLDNAAKRLRLGLSDHI